MKVTKEKRGNTLNVAISGSLDIKTAPQLKEALEGCLDGVKEVIFDLGETEYTSSAGLRVLLRTFQIMNEKEGRMVLKNVNKDFYDILKLAGFTEFLEVEQADN